MESNIVACLCKSCKSDKAKIVDGVGPHKFKLVCTYCDRFIKWYSIPFHQNEKLAKLQTKALTPWENNFITSIKENDKLSEKQHACFLKIIDKYNL